jgi:hypothetical protein
VIILRPFKYVKIKITIVALVVGAHIEISIIGITILLPITDVAREFSFLCILTAKG